MSLQKIFTMFFSLSLFITIPSYASKRGTGDIGGGAGDGLKKDPKSLVVKDNPLDTLDADDLTQHKPF